ncbi:hypothetical protein BWD14_05705 [Leptospira santarosai]|uniref:Uncharacterized protein n=1 Tax=Leptospira santarosai TaxID=28183 RepID=A0AB73LNA7_9LEPT|nr:hypothetical protein BWD14_05705 [Leptospira santarosai]
MSRNLYKIQNKALRIKFPYKIVACDRITKPKTYCIEVPSVRILLKFYFCFFGRFIFLKKSIRSTDLAFSFNRMRDLSKFVLRKSYTKNPFQYRPMWELPRFQGQYNITVTFISNSIVRNVAAH